MTAFVAPTLLTRRATASAAATSPRKARRPVHACTSPTTATASTPDLDKQFERLTHINKSHRKRAAAAIAKQADAATITRLIALLSEPNTDHRRSAVQALGMVGEAVIVPVVAVLANSPDIMVRASAAKALAAVSLFSPELRADFPDEALDVLERLIRPVDATSLSDVAPLSDATVDPVTRLSVVGCLGTLGCDCQIADDRLPGSARAIDILDVACWSTDAAVASTAVTALAQIAQNGSQQLKDRVSKMLQRIVDDEPEEGVKRTDGPKDGKMEEDEEGDSFDASGLAYVREIAAASLSQLKDKSPPPEQ